MPSKETDTENIPLNENVDEYMKREVLPYSADAFIDENKTKIGYEIPFTKLFYQYLPPRDVKDIYNSMPTYKQDNMGFFISDIIYFLQILLLLGR